MEVDHWCFFFLVWGGDVLEVGPFWMVLKTRVERPFFCVIFFFLVGFCVCVFWQKGTEKGLNRIDKRGYRLIISMMMLLLLLMMMMMMMMMVMMMMMMMMMMIMMTAAMMVVILVLITADQDNAIPNPQNLPLFPGGFSPHFSRFPPCSTCESCFVPCFCLLGGLKIVLGPPEILVTGE